MSGTKDQLHAAAAAAAEIRAKRAHKPHEWTQYIWDSFERSMAPIEVRCIHDIYTLAKQAAATIKATGQATREPLLYGRFRAVVTALPGGGFEMRLDKMYEGWKAFWNKKYTTVLDAELLALGWKLRHRWLDDCIFIYQLGVPDSESADCGESSSPNSPAPVAGEPYRRLKVSDI